MENLVSSSEAAKILGISVQGIHYRIKQGKLKSEKKDGKILVYMDDIKKSSKDEQILLLKKSLKLMENQFKDDINRLENEINLLQLAFNEMQNTKKEITLDYMSIKDFYTLMKQSKKSNAEIKSIILECVKQGDSRFNFNRETKEVTIYKSDFVDLIKS